MEFYEISLSDRDKAYIKMLGLHLTGFKALMDELAAIGGKSSAFTRDLVLANARMEEAYFHAREFVMRAAEKRNRLN
jgi:hypothetical protein